MAYFPDRSVLATVSEPMIRQESASRVAIAVPILLIITTLVVFILLANNAFKLPPVGVGGLIGGGVALIFVCSCLLIWCTRKRPSLKERAERTITEYMTAFNNYGQELQNSFEQQVSSPSSCATAVQQLSQTPTVSMLKQIPRDHINWLTNAVTDSLAHPLPKEKPYQMLELLIVFHYDKDNNKEVSAMFVPDELQNNYSGIKEFITKSLNTFILFDTHLRAISFVYIKKMPDGKFSIPIRIYGYDAQGKYGFIPDIKNSVNVQLLDAGPNNDFQSIFESRGIPIKPRKIVTQS